MSWQDFMKRLDNKGLSIMEARQKYLKEQLIFENQLSSFFQHQQNSSSGGRVSQTPSLPPLNERYTAVYDTPPGPISVYTFNLSAREGYSPADGTEISIIYTPGDVLFPKTFTITDGSIPQQSGGDPTLIAIEEDVTVSIRENGVEFATTTLSAPTVTNLGYAAIANAINNA